jgi:hypothetical protein
VTVQGVRGLADMAPGEAFGLGALSCLDGGDDLRVFEY